MRKEKKDFDYKGLFILRISFMGVGVIFLATVNKVIGLAFMTISIL